MIAEYRGAHATDMPLPDEALAAFFDSWSVPPKPIETVALSSAFGRVLAGDIRAAVDVPEFARSAMDGFALRASDVVSAGCGRPVRLPVASEVRPGVRTALPDGAAARIATGAPLPIGADSVVRLEDVLVRDRAIDVPNPVSVGADVIGRGEDITAETTFATAGTVVNAALIGALAALGHERLTVYRKPSVALISTGDEVVALGTSPRVGEVRDSNAPALRAMLHSLGVERVSCTHVNDDLRSLERAFEEALREHDAVVVSGGSSVGARDLTVAALATQRPPGVIVHGVRMKPGRPVILAVSGSHPIIGLPGNPTAAMLSLMILGSPIFERLSGMPAPIAPNFGITAEALSGKLGWACCVPVRLDARGAVHAVEHVCSTFLSSLVDADGYVIVDAQRASIPQGSLVRVHRLP